MGARANLAPMTQEGNVGTDGAKPVSSDLRLRTEPVQARSAARLSALLDAAAAVVDKVGYERLTTALVAEMAGASIGTVYRYFPDRLAVIEGLANRALSRFLIRVEQEFDDRGPISVADRVEIIVDTLVDFYRNEPGYRVIRFGDIIDARVADGMDTADSTLALALAEVMHRRDPDLRADDLTFRLQVALATCEVLVHRAFASRTGGDARFIAEAKTLGTLYLTEHLVA